MGNTTEDSKKPLVHSYTTSKPVQEESSTLLPQEMTPSKRKPAYGNRQLESKDKEDRTLDVHPSKITLGADMSLRISQSRSGDSRSQTTGNAAHLEPKGGTVYRSKAKKRIIGKIRDQNQGDTTHNSRNRRRSTTGKSTQNRRDIKDLQTLMSKLSKDILSALQDMEKKILENTLSSHSKIEHILQLVHNTQGKNIKTAMPLSNRQNRPDRRFKYLSEEETLTLLLSYEPIDRKRGEEIRSVPVDANRSSWPKKRKPNP